MSCGDKPVAAFKAAMTFGDRKFEPFWPFWPSKLVLVVVEVGGAV